MENKKFIRLLLIIAGSVILSVGILVLLLYLVAGK